MTDIDRHGRGRLAGLAGAAPLTFAAAHCDLDARVLAGFWRRSLRVVEIYKGHDVGSARTGSGGRVRDSGKGPR